MESTVAVHMHFFVFYIQICTYFGVRFMSIGVKFVLGTKQTLLTKPDGVSVGVAHNVKVFG